MIPSLVKDKLDLCSFESSMTSFVLGIRIRMVVLYCHIVIIYGIKYIRRSAVYYLHTRWWPVIIRVKLT